MSGSHRDGAETGLDDREQAGPDEERREARGGEVVGGQAGGRGQGGEPASEPPVHDPHVPGHTGATLLGGGQQPPGLRRAGAGRSGHDVATSDRSMLWLGVAR